MSAFFHFLWLALYFKTVHCVCSSNVVNLTASYGIAGTLTTDNYPGPYNSNSDCRWRIQAADANHVVVYFEDFQTESDYDYLHIYDGDSDASPSLFSDSGTHTRTWLISTSQYMYLHFTSDYSVEITGFSIKYVSSNSSMSDVNNACPYNVMAPPNAQLTMINDVIECNYKVSVSPGYKIEFLLLIDDQNRITVYDGADSTNNTIVDYAGYPNTNSYQSTGTNIFITKSYGGKFIMYYQSVNSSATAPSSISVTPPIDEYSCSSIHLQATSTAALLLTPGYPQFYPNNLQCTATIYTYNLSTSIEVKFLDVDILYCCDYAEVFDGPDASYTSLGTTWSSGQTITSTGSSLMLVFSSDSSGSLRGIKLEYIETSRAIPSCAPSSYNPHTASALEYIITSPNYPSDYDDGISEYWLITKPSENDNIVLNLRSVDIENSFDCIYDSLTIYDGACTNSPVLDMICGSSERIIEDNSGLYILIHFSTDSSVTYKGFEMVVYIGDYKEPDKLADTLKYIIPMVVVALIIIIVVGCVCYQRYKRQKRGQQVTPQTRAIEAQLITAPPLKRRTTHQLLLELQSRYGSKEQFKQPKPTPKTKAKYQPQPGTSGVSIISHPSPAPPFGSTPPPPYSRRDPTYPPNFFEASANEAMPAPKPALAPSSQLPQAPAPPMSLFQPEPASIPAASSYITPSEARSAGVYG